MNRKTLIASSSAIALAATTLVSAAPAVYDGAAFSYSKDGKLEQSALYTESNWERVRIPDEAISRLGGLNNLAAQSPLKLSHSGLPRGVVVRFNTVAEANRNDATSIGLNVSRLAGTGNVNQVGTFTLTNTATNESYSFTERVVGVSK